MFSACFINSSSMDWRPAVSMITTSYALAFASCIAFCATATGSVAPGSMYIGTSICSASTRNCSIAAGRKVSQAASKGFLLRFSFSNFASFPDIVVLPAPFKPAIMITVGLPLRVSSCASPPIKAASSSCTSFTISCPGLMAVRTFMPNAFCLTVLVNVLATL